MNNGEEGNIFDALADMQHDDGYPYYNRAGERIGRAEFLQLFENPKYRVVKQEEVRRPFWKWLWALIRGDKTRSVFVSTVWLGIDHNFDETGPPLIFETMAFEIGGDEIAQKRCATEAEAMEIHERVKVEVMA